MNESKKIGVLVFAYPVKNYNNFIVIEENAHTHLVRLLSGMADQLQVVARCRTGTGDFAVHESLDQIGGKLALALPDFGEPKWLGVRNLCHLFGSRTFYKGLRNLLIEASFIYVEAPSLEGFFTAIVAWRLGRKIIVGMRGNTLLNRVYMRGRYGRLGVFYTGVIEQLFHFTRGQAIAGLYVSQELLAQYPIHGTLQQAIANVQIHNHLFTGPRKFERPAIEYLYVGHLEQIKRVDLMLQALARVQAHLPPQWHFRIIGDGPLQDNLQQLAEELAIENHVSFLGRIPWGQELFAQYRTADVLLMASTSEGASRTLMEAMAHGLPAISTAVGTAPTLLPPKVLTPPDDLDSYATVLQAVLPNPTLLTELSYHNWQAIQPFHFTNLQAMHHQFWKQAIHLSQPT